MDHQLFEDWLLNETRLTADEHSALAAHLSACRECNSIAQAGSRLRAAGMAAPARGFGMRFEARLAAEKKRQRKYSLVGLALLVCIGFGALVWLFYPYLPVLWLTPQQAVAVWFSGMLKVVIAARALGIFGKLFFTLFFGLIPWQAWLFVPVTLFAAGVVWGMLTRRIFGERRALI